MQALLKMLAVLLFSSFMLFMTELSVIAPIAAAIAALIAFTGARREILEWAKPMTMIITIVVVLQSFTYGGLGFSPDGLRWGVTIALRLFCVLGAMSVFVYTTKTSDIASVFRFLPGHFQLLMTLSLRMLPWVKQEYENIMNAQKARGLNFRTPNLLKVYPPLMVPLFAKSLERSEKISLAMQTRGVK